MAFPDKIQYYFKEDTNQILVSGSDTVANTNAFIIADKDPNPSFNSNLTSKIANYGTENYLLYPKWSRFIFFKWFINKFFRGMVLNSTNIYPNQCNR